jgi:DNA-directed RNA polymerase subunit E"
MVEKACKQCHRVVEGTICPVCKESQLTASWKGFIVILDPEKSELAKKLKITIPGKYALRLSK